MLPAALYHHTCYRLPFLTKRTISELVAPIPWNNILDHDFIGREDVGGLLEPVDQLFSIISTPSLRFCGIEKMFFNSRFQRYRKAAARLVQVITLPKHCGS